MSARELPTVQNHLLADAFAGVTMDAVAALAFYNCTVNLRLRAFGVHILMSLLPIEPFCGPSAYQL